MIDRVSFRRAALARRNPSYSKSAPSSGDVANWSVSGSASHGGNTLPCRRDERSKIAFSPVGSSRVTLGVEGGFGGGDFSFSARAMTSSHFALRRARSEASVASLTAFMYSSAAVMACCNASLPEHLLILVSWSCVDSSAVRLMPAGCFLITYPGFRLHGGQSGVVYSVVSQTADKQDCSAT